MPAFVSLFGGYNRWLPDSAARLLRVPAGTDFQLIVYGGAMHGFTHDVGPQGPGVAYHAVSHRRSFQAIKAFLAEIFGTEVAAARAEELNC